jgi:hypothetical protein
VQRDLEGHEDSLSLLLVEGKGHIAGCMLMIAGLMIAGCWSRPKRISGTVRQYEVQQANALWGGWIVGSSRPQLFVPRSLSSR